MQNQSQDLVYQMGFYIAMTLMIIKDIRMAIDRGELEKLKPRGNYNFLQVLVRPICFDSPIEARESCKKRARISTGMGCYISKLS